MKLSKFTLISLASTALYGLSSCNDGHDHPHNADGSHPHDEKGQHPKKEAAAPTQAKEGEPKKVETQEVETQEVDMKEVQVASVDKEEHGHDHEEGEGHDDEHGHEHKEGDHDHDHGDAGEHQEEAEHVHAVKKAGPSGGRVLHEYEPHAEFFVMEDRRVRITFVNDDYKAIPAKDQVAYVVAGERSDPTELSFDKVGEVLISDKPLPASKNFPVIVQIAAKPGDDPVMAKFQADMLDCPTCDYLEYACTCDHSHGDDHEHGHDHGDGHEHKHD